MIRLNKLTDYAIVILGQMATQPALLHTSTHLAQTTGVPVATVAKVLKQLATAKLIDSHRGVTGGYRLKGTTQGITVRAVIEAMDGPIAITDCVKLASGKAFCASLNTCPSRGKWDKVNAAIVQALDTITLNDMVMTPHRHVDTSPHLINIQ